jgi:threonine aldolase
MFRSDNITGAHPKVIEAIVAANAGTAPAYASDELTKRVEKKVADLFECDCAVALVTTGSAANAIALSLLTPPYGGVLCHEHSHVYTDECGGPELFTGGAKLLPVGGAHAKLDPAELEKSIAVSSLRGVHNVKPSAISITNVSELGAVYRRDEVERIAELARAKAMNLFMDGARLANAAAAGNYSLADITWRAGVHAVSFGATKNGAIAAEAIVVFDKSRAEELAYRRKRAGQLWSKHRFLAAQFDAYVSDDLWLSNARNANRMARRLADGLANVPGVRLDHPVDANEVFATLPEKALTGLSGEGIGLMRRDGPGTQLVRLVTAFNTTEAEVDHLIARVRVHAGP